MAFSTVEFPNKVFEDFEEYNEYLVLRTKIINNLKTKTGKKSMRVVKVANILKGNSLLAQALKAWISQYLVT